MNRHTYTYAQNDMDLYLLINSLSRSDSCVHASPTRRDEATRVLIKRVHKQKHAYSFITGDSDKNKCVLDVSQGCGKGKESFDKAAAAAR